MTRLVSYRGVTTTLEDRLGLPKEPTLCSCIATDSHLMRNRPADGGGGVQITGSTISLA